MSGSSHTEAARSRVSTHARPSTMTEHTFAGCPRGHAHTRPRAKARVAPRARGRVHEASAAGGLLRAELGAHPVTVHVAGRLLCAPHAPHAKANRLTRATRTREGVEANTRSAPPLCQRSLSMHASARGARVHAPNAQARGIRIQPVRSGKGRHAFWRFAWVAFGDLSL